MSILPGEGSLDVGIEHFLAVEEDIAVLYVIDLGGKFAGDMEESMGNLYSVYTGMNLHTSKKIYTPSNYDIIIFYNNIHQESACSSFMFHNNT